MDDHFKEKCLDFLGHYCHADRSLIYVSHLQEPPPSFITHELTLSLDPDKKPTQRAIF
jgi:ABC-type molybdenum transport system ATPase subunit/photorepair protein PhrA